MAKAKIVKCTVKRKGSPEAHPSVRYVPLEVYNLWKFLMTCKHGFEILDERVSLWFDTDGDPNINYSSTNYDKVIRVCLGIYSEKDGMFHEIVRYFPEGEYPEIKPRFLSHYRSYFDSSRFPPKIVETEGVWLKVEI